MTNHQSMHAADCCGCGPKHYEYEVWQDGMVKAGGREDDYDSAKSEANHYARMYANDGPVEVRIYEQRLLSTDQIQPKRRRYDPYGSLSEYGIFPECDAQPLEAATPPPQESTMDKQHADDEVVFIDGVGAARSSVKSCRDGVQWIMVGDRVYWPLSDSDAKRLHSACCGNGSFDGPASPVDVRNVILDTLNRVHAEGWAGIESAMDEMADRLTALVANSAAELTTEIDRLRRELEEWKNVAEAHAAAADEAEDHADDLAKALAGLITWIPSADTYRRLGFDPEAPMRALKRAKLSLGGVRSA